jgi:hypothetical protein
VLAARLTVILALAVAGLMALSGGQAAVVQQVSCGDRWRGGLMLVLR